MVKKENQRIRLTRRLLKDSLVSLMGTEPINRITVKSICENAGVNRSTFYLYYTDQFALLSELENELISDSLDHLKKVNVDYDNVQYLREFLAYVKSHAGIFRILLCRQEGLSFQSAFVSTSLADMYSRHVLELPERISGYVYGFLIMGSLSVIAKWIEADFDIPCDELADILFRLSNKAAFACMP
jgi:AcrR family transcriptional regulator